ncbi:LapA family protein [Sporosarcina sp. UB5]
MDWLWAWLAFSLGAGAFYESFQVKKENKRLKERIEKLEEEVYK